jgi:hypothetical protein
MPDLYLGEHTIVNNNKWDFGNALVEGVGSLNAEGTISSMLPDFDTLGINWVDVSLNDRNYNSIATSSSGKYCSTTVMGGVIYNSNDYGVTWTQSNNAPNSNWKKVTISASGKYQSACITNGGIMYSTDYGINWTSSNATSKNWTDIKMSSNGQYQSACVNNGTVHYSNDYGTIWTSSNAPTDVWISITISSKGNLQTVTSLQHIYISNDYGTTWSVSSGDIETNAISIAMSSDGVNQTIVGSTGVYYSDTSGNSWTSSSDLTDISMNCIASSATSGYQIIGTDASGVFLTKDYGKTWQICSVETEYYIDVAMSSTSEYIYMVSSNAARTNGNIRKTTPEHALIYSLCTDGSNRLALESKADIISPIFTGTVTATGTVIANAFSGDGSALTGITATDVLYSNLTGTVPTWNQNTTGIAESATTVAMTVASSSTADHYFATATGNFTSATKTLKFGSGLYYKPSTSVLTSGSFSGDLSGNATSSTISGACTGNTASATTVAMTVDSSSATNHYFATATGTSSSSTKALQFDTGLYYNPSTNILTAGTFVGGLSGNATNATNATNIDVLSDNSSNTIMYLGFLNDMGGMSRVRTDNNLTYNPSGGLMTSANMSATGYVNSDGPSRCEYIKFHYTATGIGTDPSGSDIETLTPYVDDSQWSIGPFGGENNLWFNVGYDNVGYLNDTSEPGELNFTGQHRNYGINETINQVGFIVSSTGNYRNRMTNCDECNKLKITINESLPIVDYSNMTNDKKVWGVISNKDDYTATTNYTTGRFVSVYKQVREDRPLIVNSLGEGAMWVSNINGTIANGDYITSCNLPGLGMRQDDDILHSYTVSKATTGCGFDETELVPKKKLRYQIVTKTREKVQEVETQIVEKYEYVFDEETYIESEEYQIIDIITNLVYENVTTYDASGIPNIMRIQKTVETKQPRIKMVMLPDGTIGEEPAMETIDITKIRYVPKIMDVVVKDISGNDALDDNNNIIIEKSQIKQPIYKTIINKFTTNEEYEVEEAIIDTVTNQFVYDIETDVSGNDIYIEKYDMKYILVSTDKYSIYNDGEHTDLYKEFQHDFVNINDNSGNSIIGNEYKMAFIGCTYHCG